MFALTDIIQAVGLLSCFALLATSRIGACIRWLSFQGILFGLVPLIVHHDGLTIREIALASGNVALKGVIFPWLLLRLRARADYNREVQPFVSFIMSILFGTLALALSVWLTMQMKPALKDAPFVMLDSSIFLIFVGLFLIVSRRNALMQVIGYLVLENGIFVFGVITVVGTPLLVELGVLLDAFVGVFVMGITGVVSYTVEKDVSLAPGESAEVSGYTFKYEGTRPVAGPNYEAVEARIVISRGGKLVAELPTQKRTYRVQKNPMTHAGIDVAWNRDLFVALGDDLGQGKWSMRLQYKPLIRYIWLGAVVMAIGGLVAILDRRYRVRRTADAPELEPGTARKTA